MSELAELPDASESDFLQRAARHSGNKIDRMLEEWESISVHLEGADGNESECLWLHS